jgi:hypothetical protein
VRLLRGCILQFYSLTLLSFRYCLQFHRKTKKQLPAQYVVSQREQMCCVARANATCSRYPITSQNPGLVGHTGARVADASELIHDAVAEQHPSELLENLNDLEPLVCGGSDKYSWFCCHCGHGPHSPTLDTHCSSCHRKCCSNCKTEKRK